MQMQDSINGQREVVQEVRGIAQTPIIQDSINKRHRNTSSKKSMVSEIQNKEYELIISIGSKHTPRNR